MFCLLLFIFFLLGFIGLLFFFLGFFCLLRFFLFLFLLFLIGLLLLLGVLFLIGFVLIGLRFLILIFVGLLILFGLVIVFTLEWGQLWLQPQATSPALVVKQTVSTSSVDYSWIWAGLYRNINTPLSRLLLQFIIIIGATRTLGTIFSRIGQPAVIGEAEANVAI